MNLVFLYTIKLISIQYPGYCRIYFKSTAYVIHLLFKLAPDDEGSAYTITTEMTMQGVSSTNFESIKDELAAITAEAIGVPKTSVMLTIKETDSTSERQGGTVIIVEISMKGEDDMKNVWNTISTGSFTNSITEEISKSPTLSKAGIEIESVSIPTVKRTTTPGKDFTYFLYA